MLLNHGEEVRAFIKPGTPEITIAGLDIEKVYGDVCDFATVRSAISGCQEVYHLSAFHKLWAPDPSIFQRVNLEGTENVLRAAAEANVQRVVYTSTCDIIGLRQRRAGKEGTEEDFPDSESALPGPYGVSKWKAELCVLAYAKKGLDCVIVNPTIPIGAYDTLPTEPGRLIRIFLVGKVWAYINRRLNFVWAKDCALGHFLAMKKGRTAQRYILGGTNLELSQFFGHLERITGIHRPRIRIPYFIGYGSACLMELWANLSGKEPQASREGVRLIKHSFAFSSHKAQDELGYQPGDITEALREAVEWFTGHTYDAQVNIMKRTSPQANASPCPKEATE